MTVISSKANRQTPAPQSVLNFRDVAVSVNAFLEEPLLNEGILFRSAQLDAASIDDRVLISQTLGIKRVIDLRSRSEQLPRADGLPVQIPHVEHVKVSMPSLRHKFELVLQLSFVDILCLLWIAVFSGINQAKEFVSRKVVAPMGLTRFTLNGLGYSQRELAKTIRAILGPPAQTGSPVLVHCVHGKDRTGLVIALVLLLVGCPLAAVEYDYRSSDVESVQEREKKVAILHLQGLTPDFAHTAADLVPALDQHLAMQYGGVRGFMYQAGITDAEVESLRQVLLAGMGAKD
ncbi:hypothetical protein BROUX41_005535 [Berkeleyomyces rouxiae]|uniref:uncharacterized protein n=1 Tax=Berkeleyomyces rouxiae TaxID=2035830 RepID=UPI003B814609